MTAGAPPGQTLTAHVITVLLVDDQAIVRVALLRMLRKNHFNCIEASDAKSCLDLLEKEKVHLVLSDIMMPGMNGLELVKRMAPRIPDISVVMVSSLDNMDMAMECLRYGAYGYVLKPFTTHGILIAVANALRRRMLEQDFRDREEVLAQRVREQTLEIRSSREEISLRLLSASEHRDNETGAHVRRIGLYAAEMASLLGWGQDEVETINAASPTHDIGKIGVPDRILQKSGRLTEEEWAIMKTHTTMGANILRNSKVPFIQMGASIASSHHERWDGTGYPLGLKGKTIPMEARIVGLLDVFDALSNKRVYKRAWKEEDVIACLREEKGRHFDPELVDLFLRHFDRFKCILHAHPEVIATKEKQGS